MPNDAANGSTESLGVARLTPVEPKALLIQVPEQVERFDTHVGALDAALQQAPEVLQTIGVDLALGSASRIGFSTLSTSARREVSA